VTRAERAPGVLFGEDLSTLPAEDVLSVFDDVPSCVVTADRLAGDGLPVVELLAASGLTASKGEATRSFGAAASTSTTGASRMSARGSGRATPSTDACSSFAKARNRTTS